jgi:hypothetical protein
VRGSLLDFGWSVGDWDDNAAGDDVAAERARSGRAAPTNRSSGRVRDRGRRSIIRLQRERDPSNNAGASFSPRIYYQNDNPEFDDLDEEEGLDDDLDL